MTVLYAVVLLVSAFLVFWIQPLVARMLLPTLGGSPQVWNTCVLFFQGMLLVGYLYSHALTRRLSIRGQGLVHLIVFSIAVAIVPGSPAQWSPPEDGSIVLWLLTRLLLYVGLPYAVLSSSAPLLQSWFSATGRKGARDPYFLYAASNTGSLLALLLFPTLLERHLKISQQASHWQSLFLLLAVGVFVCLAFVWRSRDTGDRSDRTETTTKSTKREVGFWVLNAFVPSSLMLGVTTHVTTDIAAVSFLWVLPLALYLSTFIAAFSTAGSVLARYARIALPVPVLLLLAIVLRVGLKSLWLIPLELVTVTLLSMVLHRRLYEARPEAARLTHFYLWVSLGGFLGGLLNGLLAPVLFDRILEYPLVLGLACVMVEGPVLRQIAETWKAAQWQGLGAFDVASVLIVTLTFCWIAAGDANPIQFALALLLVSTSMLAAVFATGLATAPRLVALAGLFLYLWYPILAARGVIHTDRSFFGNFSVRESSDRGFEIRHFAHGTTDHGIQAEDPEKSLLVTGYYSAIAPVFRGFLEERHPARIGVTGLGAGNLACLSRPGDHLTFFEIDPAVVDVARRFFTYLDECQGEIDVVTGDARLRLIDVEDSAYDLLVLDAFSSDSVPMHLLTLEAAETYQRVLRDDGLMVFHISNHYLDLEPALAELAERLGWTAYSLSNGHHADDPMAWPSRFVLVTRDARLDALLEGVEGAAPVERRPGFELWTDDHSSLFSVLRW